MQISSCFDSGAIEVVRLDDPADIRLRLRKDNAADFHQWFHFRLTGAAGTPVRLRGPAVAPLEQPARAMWTRATFGRDWRDEVRDMARSGRPLGPVM